jgi:CRISPR/Cas system CSM-associated protein Csm3 (group 7 of RAMP superfamily)
MSKVRYEISGCLEVLTPLHLGSGAFATRNAVKGADGAEPPQVALIVRDGDDAPYLPATSLKGLLRRLAEGVLD